MNSELLTFILTMAGIIMGGIFSYALLYFRVQQQEKINVVYWAHMDKMEQEINELTKVVIRVDTQMQDFHKAAYRESPGAVGLQVAHKQ